MSIGSELRQAREARGLSLRDISARTNIRQTVLRAIEADEFQGLPGGVVMRGFLKLYAREVGLDADAIGRRYSSEIGSATAERRPSEGMARDSTFVRVGVIGGGVVLALLSIGYVVFGPSSASTTEPLEPTNPVAASPAPGAQPGAPPGDTASPAPAPDVTKTNVPTSPAAAGEPPPVPPAGPATERQGEALRVALQATGECWLSATADGRQVAYRLLNPGDRLDLQVASEAVLRIGSPGNLAVSINGRSIRPFERPGTPMTLRITPANYRDLLAP